MGKLQVVHNSSVNGHFEWYGTSGQIMSQIHADQRLVQTQRVFDEAGCNGQGRSEPVTQGIFNIAKHVHVKHCTMYVSWIMC